MILDRSAPGFHETTTLPRRSWLGTDVRPSGGVLPRARPARIPIQIQHLIDKQSRPVQLSIQTNRSAVPPTRGPAVAMVRPARVDALVSKLSLGIQDRSVYWAPPRDSTHVWAAPLPRDLAPGVRRITIRAVDEYGQEHEDAKLIEVGR